jgi:signal transduction histidine kinase
VNAGKLIPRDQASSSPVHDELAERLAGVSMMIEAATKRLVGEHHPLVQDLHGASQILRSALADIRALALRTDSGARYH